VSAEFLNGGTAVGSLVVALFFLRFWRETGDRFFALFALAFTTFAANRTLLAVLEDEGEGATGVYVVRLLAFLIILGAIVDKNRAGAPPPPG